MAMEIARDAVVDSGTARRLRVTKKAAETDGILSMKIKTVFAIIVKIL
jgi:hypothetical protein